MDQIKIGKFIAECRKSQNLTQSELAENLGVSDRSISKWETGKCMPDISLMQPLCEKLGITINELFCGERLESDIGQRKLEENIIINITDLKRKVKKIVKYTLLSFLLIPIIGLILFTCIQEYRYARIELPKEVGNASICQLSENLLQVSIYMKEGVPGFVNTQMSEGKQVYTFYRLRDTRLMMDTAWGGTYLIKLQPVGIEGVLLEVPEEIYYYSRLLWKKGMEIPMCEENMG